MSDVHEKREYTRVDAEVKVETSIGDAIVAKGVTQNISAKGAYIQCDHHLSINSRIKMALSLNEQMATDSIHIYGRVVRADDHGVAVEFEHMQVSSLEQLKRIILYNSADTEWVEAEFETAQSTLS